MSQKTRATASNADPKTAPARSAARDGTPGLLVKALRNSATRMDQIVQRRIGPPDETPARNHAK